MIKRTIEISQHPAHLSVRRGQLLIQREGEIVGQVPCEDLGLLLIDHPGTTFSHSALVTTTQNGAAVVLCGADHLPQAMMLPLGDHTQIVTRLNLQIETSKPTKKRIWKRIVTAKINAQADNLIEGSTEQKRLRNLANEVKTGDTTNREAQAAKIYWQVWLNQEEENLSSFEFRRQREGDAPNNLLNYGYAILRAALGRAIVAAGLHPALGVQHSNRSNAFCLADDLIEPLRPLVDAEVRNLYWAGHTDLDRNTKQSLLELLTISCKLNDQQGPLMVALHKYIASFVKSLENRSNQLEFPIPCTLTDTEICGS